MRRAEVPTGATLLDEPLPVELMNTLRVDRSDVQDALSDDATVTAWLRAIDDRLRSETGSQDPADVAAAPEPGLAERLRRLRDALRRLAADATGDPRPPVTSPAMTRESAIDTLNTLAGAGPELRWPAGGDPVPVFRMNGTTGDLAVAFIAHQAVDLFTGPQRRQLRACLAPGCLLYFLKQHPRREWCSPACGNRARVARHYQRHHSDSRSTVTRRP
ncbi:CGNR zinc finger domain-containing protein [Pseudonocardia sp. CA-142604]|uniref:CGNR zinc finger domain-containing protein n=1 Tax=Pseudonocardia sp. CA-142604 TaxID=3240024 RepID=UPI003D910F21